MTRCSAWNKFEGCGSRLRCQSGVDDAGRVATIFCAIGCVDLLTAIGIRFFHEGDVFVDTAGADMSFVARLCATEPTGSASMNRPDVQIVADANDPNRRRLSQC